LISIDDNEVEKHESNSATRYLVQINSLRNLYGRKRRRVPSCQTQLLSIKEYVLVYCKEANDFEGLIGEINSDVERTHALMRQTNVKNAYPRRNRKQVQGKKLHNGKKVAKSPTLR
jgi:hypothetical protein